MPDYLDVEEACEYLAIKRAHFYRLVKRYNVPKYRAPLGRNVLYRPADLDKLRNPRRRG